MALAKNMSALERRKLQEIAEDPVKWAQAFLRSFNPQTKKSRTMDTKMVSSRNDA